MKKNNFIKSNGKLPDKLPFRKYDIITYVRSDEGKVIERDVILLDRIEQCAQLDIHGIAALKRCGGCDTLTTDATCASRVWHNGGRVRYANAIEMRAFICALVKRVLAHA